MESSEKDSTKATCTDKNTSLTMKFSFLKMPFKYVLSNVTGSYFGFFNKNVFNLENVTNVMYRQTDCASLGVARALFGLCMVIDIVEERGFADIDLKWGDPYNCYFPLIHGMEPLPLASMILLYTIMWAGAFGIMFGVYFKFACAFFAIPYWYILLLDKSNWNNHSYLYGLVSVLFWGTGANKYLAIDAKTMKNDTKTVPLWNYFILRFQFFTLYFLAGLKKFSKEWLDGYSMTSLSNHWVFHPFTIFLTTEQVDFFIVHWFGFMFDLTVGFFILFDKTRIPAMIFCTAFHLMNSRLFSIGMFPYVCLATMPLFCHVNWPRKIENWFNTNIRNVFIINNPAKETKIHNNKNELKNKTTDSLERRDEIKYDQIYNDIKSETANEQLQEKTLNADTICEKSEETLADTSEKNSNRTKTENQMSKKQKCVVLALLCHICLQIFLPYSHFITKGYNNWVPGLYGYSWDMMVHSWDTILVVVKVHDNDQNSDHYVDPQAWTQNDRWQKHGDMLKQYAQCVKRNLLLQKKKALVSHQPNKNIEQLATLSSNISIYIDVWCSLNGRFQQRMFNSSVDLLTAEWHPFKPVSYVMPLLTQFSSYRHKLDQIQQQVYTWSNYTDVLFVADYPGMYLENYISNDLTNVTLTVLEGIVFYKVENRDKKIMINKGNSINVEGDVFHKVEVTGPSAACYMYTFTNSTKQLLNDKGKTETLKIKRDSSLWKELKYKINAWIRTLSHIVNAFFYFVYNVPMLRRVRLNK